MYVLYYFCSWGLKMYVFFICFRTLSGNRKSSKKNLAENCYVLYYFCSWGLKMLFFHWFSYTFWRSQIFSTNLYTCIYAAVREHMRLLRLFISNQRRCIVHVSHAWLAICHTSVCLFVARYFVDDTRCLQQHELGAWVGGFFNLTQVRYNIFLWSGPGRKMIFKKFKCFKLKSPLWPLSPPLAL